MSVVFLRIDRFRVFEGNHFVFLTDVIAKNRVAMTARVGNANCCLVTEPVPVVLYHVAFDGAQATRVLWLSPVETIIADKACCLLQSLSNVFFIVVAFAETRYRLVI